MREPAAWVAIWRRLRTRPGRRNSGESPPRRRLPRGRHLVLERLSRDGPPPCGHRCHRRDHASLGDTRAATRNQRGFKIERGAFAAGGVITTGIVSEKGTEYAKNGS